MKFLKLLIFISLFNFPLTGFTQQEVNPQEVKILTIKHEGLKEIIRGIYTELYSLDWEKHILIILPGFEAGINTFRIGLTYRSFINRKATEEEILPAGYLKHEECEILIFGTNTDKYFSKTDQIKNLEWFNYKPFPRVDGAIDILLPNYDFPSWEYSVGKDGELTFIENDWFYNIR